MGWVVVVDTMGRVWWVVVVERGWETGWWMGEEEAETRKLLTLQRKEGPFSCCLLIEDVTPCIPTVATRIHTHTHTYTYIKHAHIPNTHTTYLRRCGEERVEARGGRVVSKGGSRRRGVGQREEGCRLLRAHEVVEVDKSCILTQKVLGRLATGGFGGRRGGVGGWLLVGGAVLIDERDWSGDAGFIEGEVLEGCVQAGCCGGVEGRWILGIMK